MPRKSGNTDNRRVISASKTRMSEAQSSSYIAVGLRLKWAWLRLIFFLLLDPKSCGLRMWLLITFYQREGWSEIKENEIVVEIRNVK